MTKHSGSSRAVAYHGCQAVPAALLQGCVERHNRTIKDTISAQILAKPDVPRWAACVALTEAATLGVRPGSVRVTMMQSVPVPWRLPMH